MNASVKPIEGSWGLEGGGAERKIKKEGALGGSLGGRAAVQERDLWS